MKKDNQYEHKKIYLGFLKCTQSTKTQLKTYQIWTSLDIDQDMIKEVIEQREYFQKADEQASDGDKFLETGYKKFLKQHSRMPQLYQMINFRWYSYFSKKFIQFFENNYVGQQVINHFPFTSELSDKLNLVTNLLNYQKQTNFDIFSVIPLTFQLDFSSKQQKDKDNQIIAFLDSYIQNKPLNFIINEKQFLSCKVNGGDQQLEGSIINPNEIKKTNSENSYLWILKPSNWAQGEGICIVNSLQKLESHIQKLSKSGIKDINENEDRDTFEPKLSDKKIKLDSNPIQETQECIKIVNQNKPQKIVEKQKDKSHEKQNKQKRYQEAASKFVIQKYIANPLLFKNRKFDIRVMVLASNINEFKLYFLQDGFVRTTSEVYDSSLSSIDNKFVHLTNNSIQKHSDNYQKFETGNILCFQDLKSYLEEDLEQKNAFQSIMQQIPKSIATVFQSIKQNCINNYNFKNSFQLFGLDFIIDSNFKVWLLEVNGDPQLVFGTNEHHQNLSRRMLDDAFKLTIDLAFNRGHEFFKDSKFQLQTYPSNDNLWKQIDFIL